MMQIVLTASVLILVVVLVRYALRGMLSLRLQYALWLLVALRLLVPVTFGSASVSVLNAVPTVELPDRGEVYISTWDGLSVTGQQPAPQVGTDADDEPWAFYYPPESDSAMFFPPGETPPEGFTTVPASHILPTPKGVLTAVWWAGMAVMAGWFLWVNLSFRRKLKRSARPVEREGFPLRVYVSDAIPSPCLFGFFRPAVCLTPACLEEEGRLRHVLAHEYTHYRHGDHLWALVRCLCLTVYWFHPLVWWAAALSRRDCELACDEGALRRLGEEERTAYGRTLIGLTVARARPGDLLGAATTMTAGKGGLKERILLIAQKPKMAAVTAGLVLLICAAAVACTFTGADTGEGDTPTGPAALTAALADVPQELAESVTVTVSDPEEAPADYAGSGAVLLTAYHTATNELWQAEGLEGGGWICDLYRYDQAEFESRFLSSFDNSGLTCFAKDDTYYYALQVPTDVQWDDSTRADYEAAYAACTDWVRETVLSAGGAQPFTQEDYLPGTYTYEGAHYDAVYYPYLHVNGDLSVVYTFVLSQPAAQGAGGIWCVERWYDDHGTQYLARPDTELTAAEYFAGLQAQADAGGADWALDPVQVCLDYAKNALGHQYVYEDNFEPGEPYEGERTGEITVVTPETAVQSVLDAFAAGETVRLTMTTADGAEDGDYTAPTGFFNSPFRSADTLTTYFDWNRLYAAQPPGADHVLTLWAADGEHSITVYWMEKAEGASSAASIVRVGSGGVATWYSAHYHDSSDVFSQTIFSSLRSWYDEVEVNALHAQVTVTEGEPGWPEYQDLVPGYVARTLGQRHWEAFLQVSPNSRYILDEVAVLSAQVYDMDDLDDPSSIAFNLTMASRGGNMDQVIWQAGAGSGRIEDGDYAGWWDHFNQCVAQRTDGVWRIVDMGTGGYRAAGQSGDLQPDIHSCAHDDLMYFLLNNADGAYAEGGQYELSSRFLAQPADVLAAMGQFQDMRVERWPDYQGDAAQWLAECLVSEFAVMRGGADTDAFLASLESQQSGEQADMAALVLEAWQRAAT